MNKLEADSTAISVARRIAGEDLATDDYVTVLNEVYELPSFLWCDSLTRLDPGAPVTIQYMAHNAGVPFRVLSVCLPFVYVKPPRGEIVSLDLRRQELVKLESKRARKIWKKLRRKKKKKSS